MLRPNQQPNEKGDPPTALRDRWSAVSYSILGAEAQWGKLAERYGKAHTRVELLICRDSHLAALEVEMVSIFHQTLSRLPQDAQLALQREHLAWFKNYSRTCNQSADDVDRAACVANYLSQHTAELSARPH